MFISFLITAISISSLHCMDNTTQIKEDWNLYKQLRLKSTEELVEYRQSHDINKAIDLAEYARDGHLMAKLVHICMPQELVRQHIAPHLATTIVTKYKYKIVSDKIFKPELIDCNNEWSFFVQHDGNYFHVPKINNADKPYIQWDASSNHRKAIITDAENRVYTIEKIFMHDKDNFSSISSLSQNKDKLYLINHEIATITTFACDYQTAQFIFSNDGSALAINEAQSLTLNLYNVLSSDITRIFLVAPITTLCTAHRSPLFAIGTNQPSNDLMIINYKTTTPYRYVKFTNPIICMEFSPDDTQLLMCSNNEEDNTYQIKVFNIKNLETLIFLHNSQSTGQIFKAFFINNGDHVVVAEKGGRLKISNISSNQALRKYLMHWSYRSPENTDMPLMTWSNKHKLLISSFNGNIILRKTTTGKCLDSSYSGPKFIGLGLLKDKNSIILMDEEEKAYQMELFSKADCDTIDFIEKKANIIQLYEILILYRQHHKSLFSSSPDSARAQAIVKSIESYIYQQQK